MTGDKCQSRIWKQAAAKPVHRNDCMLNCTGLTLRSPDRPRCPRYETSEPPTPPLQTRLQRGGTLELSFRTLGSCQTPTRAPTDSLQPTKAVTQPTRTVTQAIHSFSPPYERNVPTGSPRVPNSSRDQSIALDTASVVAVATGIDRLEGGQKFLFRLLRSRDERRFCSSCALRALLLDGAEYAARPGCTGRTGSACR